MLQLMDYIYMYTGKRERKTFSCTIELLDTIYIIILSQTK